MIDPLPPHVLAQANNETVHKKHPGTPRAGKSAKVGGMSEREILKLANNLNGFGLSAIEKLEVVAAVVKAFEASRPAPVEAWAVKDHTGLHRDYESGYLVLFDLDGDANDYADMCEARAVRVEVREVGR